MKNSKRVLSLACAAVMLSAVLVPASAETLVEQQGNSIALTRESAAAQQLQARNYKIYNYAKVPAGGSERSLVSGKKAGQTSRLAENEVTKISNSDEVYYHLEYKHNDVSDEYAAYEGEFDMEYDYSNYDNGFKGTVTLLARNRAIKNTAVVTGKIQFN